MVGVQAVVGGGHRWDRTLASSADVVRPYYKLGDAFMELTGVNYIAWWGAVLSTLLAGVKLWELWNDRFRIEVGYNFTSDPERGNEIFIRNLSTRPIILTYWELLHGAGIWPFLKLAEIESPGPDTSDIRIEPHSSKTFTFVEGGYFDCDHKTLQGRKVYMRLSVAGRRPLLKKVYG